MKLGLLAQMGVSTSPLTPPVSFLQNWYAPENLDISSSMWIDTGYEGSILTQAFTNPVAVGTPIDGLQAIYGNLSNALQSTATSMSGARDAGWVDGTYTVGGTHPAENGKAALATVIEAGMRSALA